MDPERTSRPARRRDPSPDDLPDDLPDESPDEPPDELRLTVAAAARRLGIAPATLRTWDRRYGLGPSDHAPGRHRRYAPDDVARLELMQHALVRGASAADAARYARAARLPQSGAEPRDRPRAVPEPAGGAPPVAVPAPRAGRPLLLAEDGPVADLADRVRVGGRVLRLPGAGRRARGLGRAALSLDHDAVRRLLAESIAATGVTATWDAVARPVLAAVADRWADTGAGVEIEHLLSDGVLAVLGAHAAAAPSPSAVRPVLLAAVPGERHTLPLAALTAVLADAGVPCRPLGADLPADALASAIRRVAPAAVVLWSLLPQTADGDLLRALPRTRPRFRTFAAGPGWDTAELPTRAVRLTALDQAGLVMDVVGS